MENTLSVVIGLVVAKKIAFKAKIHNEIKVTKKMSESTFTDRNIIHIDKSENKKRKTQYQFINQYIREICDMHVFLFFTSKFFLFNLILSRE